MWHSSGHHALAGGCGGSMGAGSSSESSECTRVNRRRSSSRRSLNSPWPYSQRRLVILLRPAGVTLRLMIILLLFATVPNPFLRTCRYKWKHFPTEWQLVQLPFRRKVRPFFRFKKYPRDRIDMELYYGMTQQTYSHISTYLLQKCCPGIIK